jgi:CRISPR-associated endonuclease/helicase Cas3
MTEQEFGSVFIALTGNDNGHFPWQWALYQRFEKGDIPASCNLATGLGKTSVIALWLIALANNRQKMPRRLVYVVNRRTVVDQTTTEVEKLRDNLDRSGVGESLRQMCAIPMQNDERPLAISTLRGQFADNREWSADPSRPAVICGTVDMIGSRLLFSGYGVGYKSRPLYAGFLGQDTLLVHDEAHLEPAFQQLLLEIENEQKRCADFRQLRVMELTATSRAETDAFPNEQERLANEEHVTVQKRINARKEIVLHEVSDEKRELAEKIVQLALVHKDSRKAILVFTRKVDDVEKIVAKLEMEKQSVQQLTGTLRGLERDRMADPRRSDGCPIFARFLPQPKPDVPESEQWKVKPKNGTVYLVCNSAGEVGINASGDHVACDLTSYESMAQRFGRANRFGMCPDTRIDIVHPGECDDDEYERSRALTLDLLKKLHGDGSPKALGHLNASDRMAAFAPPPTVLPVSDILFDAWALTTIRDILPSRPKVEPYLHGISATPPETHVAWREEVGVMTDETLRMYDPGELLDAYPLKPHELLRDTTSRVFDRLKKLKAGDETPAWIVSDDEHVQVTTMGAIRAADQEDLQFRTVLLPPFAGGLKNGMLTSDSPHANDVADEWRDAAGELRRRVWLGDEEPLGMKLQVEIVFPNHEDEESEPEKVWLWFVRPRATDSPGAQSNTPYPLQPHLNDAKTFADRIVGSLNLATDIAKAVVLGALHHDLGKRRRVWQNSIGNMSYPTEVWAKSGKRFAVGERSPYRHEFGSLLDIAEVPEFKALCPDVRELILHLIAAHHGRGRPHFPTEEAFDFGKEVTDVALEVPRRFGRLQRRFGRWGLAYLESLVRAADILASRKAEGDLP